MTYTERIQKSILQKRKRLAAHDMYASLEDMEDVKTFMEWHVFAVWDFMSLLKSLQGKLTCVEAPWIPTGNAKLGRLINEIVLSEESDINELGEPKSHFEMYLDAMEECGADTSRIQLFLKKLQEGDSVKLALEKIKAPESVQDFVNGTFEIIEGAKAHEIASAFTFGREDIIPDMFLGILNKSEADGQGWPKLKYYFDRHIELDGDEHGPLALEMIQELCGNDSMKWQQAEYTANKCLDLRIALWNGVAKSIDGKLVK